MPLPSLSLPKSSILRVSVQKRRLCQFTRPVDTRKTRRHLPASSTAQTYKYDQAKLTTQSPTQQTQIIASILHQRTVTKSATVPSSMLLRITLEQDSRRPYSNGGKDLERTVLSVEREGKTSTTYLRVRQAQGLCFTSDE